MDLAPRGLTRSIVRFGQAAQNALEVARFGGLETGEESTPYEVVSSHRVYKLRRYGDPTTWGDDVRRPPIILVPPMMLSADVYDVSPQSSAVGQLAAAGVDPWVVDFGAQSARRAGSNAPSPTTSSRCPPPSTR